MAEKAPVIIVKKINVQAAGAHGGSWKVAFADFMTALMCFFLVMWLLNQTPEVKKNVADYFSTPSVIEYNFSNYGVELTLEKLFLDLVNEPLKVLQDLLKPADATPNVMAMGSKKVVLHHVAEALGDVAEEVEVNADEITFEIPDKILFLPGTARPSSQFVDILEKVKMVTSGLEESNIFIESQIYTYAVPTNSPHSARAVAEERLDLIQHKVEVTLEHESVDIFGKTAVDRSYDKRPKPGIGGFIKFRIKQKEQLKDGRKPRQLQDVFEAPETDMSVYDGFVNQLVKKKSTEKK